MHRFRLLMMVDSIAGFGMLGIPLLVGIALVEVLLTTVTVAVGSLAFAVLLVCRLSQAGVGASVTEFLATVTIVCKRLFDAHLRLLVSRLVVALIGRVTLRHLPLGAVTPAGPVRLHAGRVVAASVLLSRSGKDALFAVFSGDDCFRRERGVL